MIGGFLILCSLVIAFYEKPHLFQRPTKPGKIIVIIMLIATAIFSFIQDHYNNIQQEKDSATIDSLHGESKALYKQIDTLRKENKAATREYEDSLVNYHLNTTSILAGHGIKIDALRDEVKHFDTTNGKEVLPTLDIEDLPEIKKINASNENVISYSLNSYSVNSHLIDYTYTTINVKDDRLDGDPASGGGNTLNEATIISPNHPYGLMWFLDREKKVEHITDTFALAMEFTYKSKSGIIQPPLRKIYLIQSLQLSNTDNRLYKRINDMLIEKRVWAK